nr:putative peptide maturation dehydrogenase [Lysobacter sp. CAU 1642]
MFIECGQRVFFDPAALFQGEVNLGPQAVLRAWRPGRTTPIEIDGEEAAVLAALAPTTPRPLPDWLSGERRVAVIRRLADLGLMACDPITDPALEDWWTPAALYHFGSRWDGVLARDDVPTDTASSQDAFARSRMQFEALAARKGPAPDHRLRHGEEVGAVDLPGHARDEFDNLLQARETHRLFRTDRSLSLEQVAGLLRRSFGVIGEAALGGGLTALRKSVPSGGGMHPIEAYVLAVDVEGLAAGWYHYRADQHRLAPIRHLGVAEARERVCVYGAGQRYFASAPLLVALAPRFPRHHWKYPQHPKALRVILLEAGHLGQTFYLAATHEGLGAFLTCAINEADLDRDLGLDGVGQGCIALMGAGWPSDEGAALRLSHYVKHRSDR